MEKEYIQTGKLKYVIRDFPLESIHKNAFKAAQAAYCAGQQGKYWEMHERLFVHQNALNPSDLPSHAQALALDAPTFHQCLESEQTAAVIRKDIEEGQKLGVRSTPTFLIGLTEQDGSRVKALKLLRGARVYTAFKSVLDGLLAAQKR